MGAKIAIAGQNAITITTLTMRSTTARPIAAVKKRRAVGVLLPPSINSEQRSRSLRFGGGFRDSKERSAGWTATRPPVGCNASIGAFDLRPRNHLYYRDSNLDHEAGV